MEGGRLLFLATQPDGTLPLGFTAREHQVDCVIQKFPLAAGMYMISSALAIPTVQWLWKGQDIASLSVSPCDVYGSGYAPKAARSLIAIPHEWRRVVN